MKKRIHFTPTFITEPVHPISITIVGIGGTGSRLLSELVGINTIMLKLGYPGIDVLAVDADYVSNSNIGRGEFYYKEDVQKNKAQVMIERINLNTGFNWKWLGDKIYDKGVTIEAVCQSNILVSCVDSVQPRLSMIREYKKLSKKNSEKRNNYYAVDENERPVYFIDCGNSYQTGQVIVGTAGIIRQPKGMTEYNCIESIPNFNNIFSSKELKEAGKSEDSLASCSTYEAIGKQHPYINREVAMKAAEFIYSIIKENSLDLHAVFFDISTGNYKFKSV